MVRDAALRPLATFQLLKIDGKIDVRDAAVGKRRAAGQVGDILHVSRPHHSGVVNSNVTEYAIEVHVLLGMRIDEIVKVLSRQRQYRLPIQFGVIETVQQMKTARAGGRNADSQLAGVLGVGAGHERSRLFVANLNEAELIFSLSQRLHNSIYAVAG